MSTFRVVDLRRPNNAVGVGGPHDGSAADGHAGVVKVVHTRDAVEAGGRSRRRAHPFVVLEPVDFVIESHDETSGRVQARDTLEVCCNAVAL